MDGTWQRVAQGAGTVVRTLVRQGEAAAERIEQVVEELLGRVEADREALTRLQATVDRLEARVAELEERLTMADR